MTPDYASTVQAAIEADWEVAHPDWDAVLEVDDDFAPTEGSPVLLIADDTGPAVVGGSWMAQASPRRPILRLTAFAAGRTEAREVVTAGAEYVLTNKPGIARVEDVSDPLITKDRDTGAMLASITMPVIVRQTA